MSVAPAATAPGATGAAAAASAASPSTPSTSAVGSPISESLVQSICCPSGHHLQPGTAPDENQRCTVCNRPIKLGWILLSCEVSGCKFNCCSICSNGPTQRIGLLTNGESSVPPKCSRADCLCHAIGDHQPFCSDACRDGKGTCGLSRRHCIPTTPFLGDVAKPANCMNRERGCPCQSYSGLPGHFCCKACAGGKICSRPSHMYPGARCANSSKGCQCWSHDGAANSYCCYSCAKTGHICKLPYHLRPDLPCTFKPPDDFFHKIVANFKAHWDDPTRPAPEIVKVVGLQSSAWVQRRFDESVARLKAIRGDANVQYLYHGTFSARRCTVFHNNVLCREPECGVCGITRGGFDPARIGKGYLSLRFVGKSVTDPTAVGFRRFGNCICACKYSTKKPNDYSNSWSVDDGKKRRSSMLVLRVALGREFIAAQDMPTLEEPPAGYDSVYGITKKHPQATSQTQLNHDECCVYSPDPIVVAAVIYYEYPAPQK